MCYLYILAVLINAFDITKKEGESSVKGRICGFSPLVFPNLGHLERCLLLLVLVTKTGQTAVVKLESILAMKTVLNEQLMLLMSFWVLLM